MFRYPSRVVALNSNWTEVPDLPGIGSSPTIHGMPISFGDRSVSLLWGP